MTIKELARRARAININALKRQAVVNNTKVLEDLQRKQLRQGLNADGGTLGKYAPGYGAFKSTLSTYNAPAGVPDLFLTGSFHRGIKMKLSGDDYTFDSSDGKSDKLSGKYRPLWGLNSTTFPQAQITTTLKFDELAGKQLGLI